MTNRGRVVRLLAALLLPALMSTVGSSARAEAPDTDTAAAQALFDEAKVLMKDQRYPEACAKFLASHRIDAKSGTLVNLADCYEKNGQTASAWLRYLQAAELSARLHQEEREAYARQHAGALMPTLSRLTIDAPQLAAGSVVLRDGTAVDPGALGTAVPIDPGRHTVEVMIGHRRSWSSLVDVPPGTRVAVEVPPEKAPAAKEKPLARPHSSWATQKTLSVALLGISAVGLGVGTYFGVKAGSSWSDAKAGCAAAGCPADSVLRGQDAKTEATVSTIAFIASGALLCGAAVLWFTATVDPSRGSGGVVAVGRF